MRIEIEFSRATMYADVRERDSIAIACTSLWDGLAHFFNTHRSVREISIEAVEVTA